MKHFFLILLLLTSSSLAFSDASISPSLFFLKQTLIQKTAKISQPISPQTASVTIKFSLPPDIQLLEDLENHGVRFKRDNGVILHSLHIYPATVFLDSLSSIARFPEIEKIEIVIVRPHHPPLTFPTPRFRLRKYGIPFRIPLSLTAVV